MRTAGGRRGAALAPYRYQLLNVGEEEADQADDLEGQAGSSDEDTAGAAHARRPARLALGAAVVAVCLLAAYRAFPPQRPPAAEVDVAEGNEVMLLALHRKGQRGLLGKGDDAQAASGTVTEMYSGGKWRSWGRRSDCSKLPEEPVPEGSKLVAVNAPLALEPCMYACECTPGCHGVQFQVQQESCKMWLGSGRRLLKAHKEDANTSSPAEPADDSQCLQYRPQDNDRRACEPAQSLAAGTPVAVRRDGAGEAPPVGGLDLELGVVKDSGHGGFLVEFNGTNKTEHFKASSVLDLGQFTSELKVGDHVLAKLSNSLIPVLVVKAHKNSTYDVVSHSGEVMPGMKASEGVLPIGIAAVYADANGSLPARGTDRNIVEFPLRIEHMAVDKLSKNATLLDDIKATIKAVISEKTYSVVPPIAVSLVSDLDAAQYRVSISPPEDGEVHMLTKHLSVGTGKLRLERALDAGLANITGIEAVSDGPLAAAIGNISIKAEGNTDNLLGSGFSDYGIPVDRLELTPLQQHILIGELLLATTFVLIGCWMSCHLQSQVVMDRDARTLKVPEHSCCGSCCPCFCYSMILLAVAGGLLVAAAAPPDVRSQVAEELPPEVGERLAQGGSFYVAVAGVFLGVTALATCCVALRRDRVRRQEDEDRQADVKARQEMEQERRRKQEERERARLKEKERQQQQEQARRDQELREQEEAERRRREQADRDRADREQRDREQREREQEQERQRQERERREREEEELRKRRDEEPAPDPPKPPPAEPPPVKKGGICLPICRGKGA